ncbi:MAG: hypothetical protein N4A45_12160 [Flavobacteriales bacterium]|nr:hypothetical protein [Flavobacteriales bacterium]
MKLFFTSLLLVIGFVSCTKMPVYYCLDKKNIDFSDVNYSGYDKAHSLRWLIFEDQENLHLWLDTDNPITIRKILYGGMKIYFDQEAKKGKSRKIIFPMETPKKFTQEDFGEKVQEVKLGSKGFYATMIDNVPKIARFVTDSTDTEYNYLYEAKPAKIELGTKGRLLEYKVTIPKKSIAIEHTKAFSIGMETGKLDIEYPDDATTNPAGTSPVNNQAPVVGGGLNNRQSNLRTYSDMEAPMKVWFKVERTEL